MTLLELVNRLKSEAGRSGGPLATIDAAGEDDARLIGFIRHKWTELQVKKVWSWQRKTIATDATLLDDVGSYTAAALGITNWRAWWPEDDEYRPFVYPVGDRPRASELIYARYEVFRSAYLVVPPAAGEPRHWSIDGAGNLLIGPVPSGGDWRLQIDYRAKPTELLLDADVPLLPEHFHLLLVWSALGSLSSFDAAPEVRQRAQEEYAPMYDDLVNECAPKMRLIRRGLA